MSRYTRKVCTAMLVVTIISFISGWQNPDIGYVIAVCGAIFIGNRHLSRCNSCHSWRMVHLEDRIEDEPPSDNATIWEYRRCLSCGNCCECDGCLGACPEDAVIKLGPGHRYEFNYGKCTGCGECWNVCPLKRNLSEFDYGLGFRPAIYVPFPQAVPARPVIDPKTCAKLIRNDD